MRSKKFIAYSLFFKKLYSVAAFWKIVSTGIVAGMGLSTFVADHGCVSSPPNMMILMALDWWRRSMISDSEEKKIILNLSGVNDFEIVLEGRVEGLLISVKPNGDFISVSIKPCHFNSFFSTFRICGCRQFQKGFCHTQSRVLTSILGDLANKRACRNSLAIQSGT